MLTYFFDRDISEDEERRLYRAQTMMCVFNSYSWNSQENPATLAFYKLLRPSYKPLTRPQLASRTFKLVDAVHAAVVQQLAQGKWCTLAVDGWKEPGHTPTIAFTATGPGRVPYL